MRFSDFLRCALVTVGFGLALDAKALDISISNQSGVPNSEVWVMFGGQNTFSGTLITSNSGTIPIAFGTSYQLSTLKSINLTSVIGGKIFFAYSGTTSGFSGNDGNPHFSYPYPSPNVNLRWDKVEITYQPGDTSPGSSAVNLSAVDFFSIPMELHAFSGTKQVGFSGWIKRTNTSTIYKSLSNLLSGSNTTNAAVPATGDAIKHSVKVGSGKSASNVLRIVSPSSIGGFATNPYPDPTAYFKSLQQSGTKAATVAEGLYLGASGTVAPAKAYERQNFSFTFSVGPTGDITMKGKGDAVGEHTITIKKDQQKIGFYGSNPAYFIGNAKTAVYNSNCVFDQAISDYFAGLNLGLVNSSTWDPRFKKSGRKDEKHLFKNESTAVWFCNLGTPYFSYPKLTQDQLFSMAQPNNKFYNQYAQYLSSIFEGYSYSYSDKTAKPLVDLTPGKSTSPTLLQINLLSDVVKRSNGVAAAPEETGKPIKDNRTVVSYLRVSGQSGESGAKMPYSSIGLNLDIDHPSVAELKVKLMSPTGQVFVIHDGGDEGENLRLTESPLPSEKSGNPNGVWTLTVTDTARGNTGTLNDWSLSFP